MRSPTVSVIIPTYNRGHLINRAINTVLVQTFQDFEVIVVDDGSTDNTIEVVNRLSDDRVSLLKINENRGASFARNRGIELAAGRYIAFQDSDDEWKKDKLKKQIQVFNNAAPEVGLVYTGYWNAKDDGKTYLPSPSIRPKEGYLHNVLLEGNFIAMPTALVRKECLLRVGLFDEHLPRLQDWDLWLRISKECFFRFINEPLATAYFQAESISSHPEKLAQAFDLILQKHTEDFEKNRKALAQAYFFIGSHLLHSDLRTNQQRIYLKKAAKLNPLEIRYISYAFISCLGDTTWNKIRTIYRKIKGIIKHLSKKNGHLFVFL